MAEPAIKRIPPALMCMRPRIVLAHMIAENDSHMMPFALLYAGMSEISDSSTVLPDQNHIGSFRRQA